MKKAIKITAVLMAVIILAAFTDVPKKHWAYSVVEQAQKEGIVKGVTEKIFEPDRNISKQEVALMLYRVHAMTSAEEDISAYPETFADDLKTAGIADWAKPELAYGFEKGYWTVDDFAGDGASLASRELIARWTCSINQDVFRNYSLRVLPYADVNDIDPAYYSYVDCMYKNGIMKGTDQNLFNAKKNISRAEVAAVTVRALNVIRKTDKYIEAHPFIYEYGLLSSVNEKARTFRVGESFVNLAEGTEIVINGSAGSFADLNLLKDKKISVSQYILGSNTNCVLIQSSPMVYSGIVETSYSGTPASGVDSYEVVSINVGGVSTDFIKNAKTEVLRTVSPGNEVQFISDGIYLLEIK